MTRCILIRNMTDDEIGLGLAMFCIKNSNFDKKGAQLLDEYINYTNGACIIFDQRSILVGM